MAVITPPIFLQAGSHAADSVRRALGGLVVYRNSIVGTGDWATTQNGTPNMSVNVAEGRGLVVGTEATYQGGYFCESQGVTNLAITAANATNPRIDLIVARVKDAAYSGAVNAFSLEVVTGTAAASPVAPATPVDSYVVATIAVGAAVTSILTANVTDNRTTTTSGLLTAAGGTLICTSTTRPASPVNGMQIYETDTTRTAVWNGTAWSRLSYSTANGRTGFFISRVAVQSIPNAAVTNFTFDTETNDSDNFGSVPSAAYTVPTGLDGIYIITGSCAFASAANGTQPLIRLAVGGNTFDGPVSLAAGIGSVGATIPLVATNTIALGVFQNNGVAQNCTAKLWAYRIGN